MALKALADFGPLVVEGALLYTIASSSQYSSSLPEDIQQRLNSPIYQQIQNALVTQIAQHAIDTNHLTKDRLSTIARNVNASFIHVSGNCVLLSGCMLYNLTHSKEILAAKNTFPIYTPVNPYATQKLLFGKHLDAVASKIQGVANLEKSLLDHYHQTGQRFFIINNDYEIPVLGRFGHCFNAVILLDHKKEAFVQIVDAWKTLNPTPTIDQFSNKGTFQILSFSTN